MCCDNRCDAHWALIGEKCNWQANTLRRLTCVLCLKHCCRKKRKKSRTSGARLGQRLRLFSYFAMWSMAMDRLFQTALIYLWLPCNANYANKQFHLNSSSQFQFDSLPFRFVATSATLFDLWFAVSQATSQHWASGVPFSLPFQSQWEALFRTKSHVL